MGIKSTLNVTRDDALKSIKNHLGEATEEQLSEILETINQYDPLCYIKASLEGLTDSQLAEILDTLSYWHNFIVVSSYDTTDERWNFKGQLGDNY
jgi:hypothetical protein